MDRKRGPERDGGDRFAKRDRRSGKVIKVLCPYYSAGAVIGKGGEAIKQIKEESGANIQVSKNNVRFPNSDERVISISGELEGLQKVVAFVQEKIRTDKVPPHVKNINTNQNDARKSICKIVVPSNCVGKIIGKSGANVNRLKDQFSVKIGTMKKEEAIAGLDERIITVESEDAANVDGCVAEMVKDVYEDERGNMDYNVDYEAFGGSSERGGGGERGGDRGGDSGGDRYGGSQPRSYGDRGGYSAPAAPKTYGSTGGGYGGYGSGGYGGASYGDKGGYGGGDRGYSGGDRGYSQGASYGAAPAAPAAGGRADYGRSSGGAGGGYGSYGSSDGYSKDSKPSYGGRY